MSHKVLAKSFINTPCPAPDCGHVDGKQAMVWHLYSVHGWEKPMLAIYFNYGPKSIAPIISIYSKRARENG